MNTNKKNDLFKIDNLEHLLEDVEPVEEKELFEEEASQKSLKFQVDEFLQMRRDSRINRKQYKREEKILLEYVQSFDRGKEIKQLLTSNNIPMSKHELSKDFLKYRDNVYKIPYTVTAAIIHLTSTNTENNRSKSKRILALQNFYKFLEKKYDNKKLRTPFPSNDTDKLGNKKYDFMNVYILLDVNTGLFKSFHGNFTNSSTKEIQRTDYLEINQIYNMYECFTEKKNQIKQLLIIRLLLESGMMPHNIQDIKISDVGNDSIAISHKQRGMYLPEVILELSPDLLTLMNKYLGFYNKETQYLFYPENDLRYTSEDLTNYLSKAYIKIRSELGFKINSTIIRNTFIVHSLRAGRNAEKIRKQVNFRKSEFYILFGIHVNTMKTSLFEKK